MTAPTQPVTAGQRLKIPASIWNELLRLVQSEGRKHFTGAAQRLELPGGYIAVQNDSGEARPPFSVLAISDVIQPPDTPEAEAEFPFTWRLKCVTPGEEHCGKFVILQSGADNEAIGKAMVSGATFCRVYINDEAHKYADIEVGTTERLASRDRGAAKILWKPAGTGEKMCVVSLGTTASAACESDCDNGDIDPSIFAGYDETKTQYLRHLPKAEGADRVCLGWVDAAEC